VSAQRLGGGFLNQRLKIFIYLPVWYGNLGSDHIKAFRVTIATCLAGAASRCDIGRRPIKTRIAARRFAAAAPTKLLPSLIGAKKSLWMHFITELPSQVNPNNLNDIIEKLEVNQKHHQ
jgi:hypothetical protein